jgi:hypothetical protein
MNFIKKVFEKNIDGATHLQFQKFGKGEFIDRAIIEVKKTGKGYSLKTSSEFSNGLVKDIAEKLGIGKTKVTGAIVSTNDLTEKLDFKEKKQFQGVKKYLIDKEMSGKEIIELINEFPKTFFALSFEFKNYKLKIKPKAPKSAKAKNKDGGTPKADFCSLKTSDEALIKSFVFERENFKEVKINHTFFIDEIIMPESEKDYAKIREMAKRKGRIVRKAVIDGEETIKEFDFEV